MTPYQERIAEMLRDGCRLERRVRYGQFARKWPVVVLVASDGVEVGTVRAPTVEKLVAAGFRVAASEEQGTP